MKAATRLGWTILIFGAIPIGALALAYTSLSREVVDQAPVSILITSAWAILAASIGLPLSLTALALICGDRRWLLSVIFPPLTVISVIGLACLLVLQGALLVGAIGLYAENHHGAGAGVRIAIGVTIAILATTFALIRAAAKVVSPMHIDASGLLLRPEDSPRLFDHVRRLAAHLGAPAPSQIILGLEPTFYVTTTPVRLAGANGSMRGETLYISALLARLFTQQEFAAVVGHELGHFRGKDTIYSRRFAPAFAALDHAIVSMSGDDGEGPHLLALPALITLGLLYDIFAVNVAKVSRTREFEADRAGAECATNRDIATALLKSTWYDLRWNSALDRNADRLAKLDVAENLSLEFARNERDQAAEMAAIMVASPPHPIDTHPPISERLAALGFSERNFSAADIEPATASADSIIDDLENREATLSQMQHSLMIAMRYGALGERDQRATLVRAAALLGAHFASVGVAGDPSFLNIAEERGRVAMRDFDVEAFRARLASPELLPDLAVMVNVIGSLISDEGKHVLLGYLESLSQTTKALEEPFAYVRAAWRPA